MSLICDPDGSIDQCLDQDSAQCSALKRVSIRPPLGFKDQFSFQVILLLILDSVIINRSEKHCPRVAQSHAFNPKAFSFKRTHQHMQ